MWKYTNADHKKDEESVEIILAHFHSFIKIQSLKGELINKRRKHIRFNDR